MLRPHRGHPGYWAFVLHRISGVALAAFLPLHFVVLARVLQGPAALDAFLHWTESPLVKAAEVGLVTLLAAHLTGGLRLMVVELLPWRESVNTLISVTAGVSIAVGLMFALSSL